VRTALELCNEPLPAATYREKLAAIASKIRDPAYSLRQYHDDMLSCFPELQLYLVEADESTNASPFTPRRPEHCNKTMSGRSPDDEYKRTIGALFAVYWLLRLELPSVHGSDKLDGQRGWCFGATDPDKWSPPTAVTVRRLNKVVQDGVDLPSVLHAGAGRPRPDSGAADEAKIWQDTLKRLAFCTSFNWIELNQLLIDAGLLKKRPDGGVDIDVERTVSMLALTAIHDIMKNEALLPIVLPEHAPYANVTSGSLIHDHDLALGYVLEHDPECLPAFAKLDPSQQRPIKFTQAKLNFNHGWLVQAEAPPGALFCSFKKLLSEGHADAADIAFYFVHWLTDLAGAVPSPLAGCQQFVIRFPRPVLASFTRSFPLVQRLAALTETQLNEEFLEAWWPREYLGAPPTGPDAVALMRLVVHMQTDEDRRRVRAAWNELTDAQRKVLEVEMARTGVSGQRYTCREKAREKEGSACAFLLYYGPMFLRSAVADDPVAGLEILSEIYRAARVMFPPKPDESGAGVGVTVHLGQLKSAVSDGGQQSLKKKVVDVHNEGSCWVLLRKGATEAVVEPVVLADLPALLGGLRDGARDAVMLRLWPDAVALGIWPKTGQVSRSSMPSA